MCIYALLFSRCVVSVPVSVFIDMSKNLNHVSDAGATAVACVISCVRVCTHLCI